MKDTIGINEESDYIKYRGKCKEFAEEAVKEKPGLVLVRGWYECPYTNRKEEHWWTKDKQGNIYDPSAKQFLSKGIGEYIEYDGTFECEECGKLIQEDFVIWAGRFPVCSGNCYCRLVGVTL